MSKKNTGLSDEKLEKNLALLEKCDKILTVLLILTAVLTVALVLLDGFKVTHFSSLLLLVVLKFVVYPMSLGNLKTEYNRRQAEKRQ